VVARRLTLEAEELKAEWWQLGIDITVNPGTCEDDYVHALPLSSPAEVRRIAAELVSR
jgi:hypothetical protein